MKYTDFFSRKIAKGAAFFNREEQRRTLMVELSSSSSVWLSGERRVGKTSVAINVCSELSATPERFDLDCFAWSECDISSCATIDAVKRKILHTIAEAASQISSKDSKAIERLKNLFSRFDPELVLGGKDMAKLSLKLKPQVSMENPLREAITALDELATKQNAKAVLIVDEFQTLAEIKQDEGEKVEWDIRAALQHSEHIAMVFAGSKRRMMSDIFLSKNRGLYGMCRRVKVFGLPEKDCLAHLLTAATHCKFSFEDDAFQTIYELTGGHPRDFSHLCLQVFENATFSEDKPKHISSSLVESSWGHYVQEVVIDEVNAMLKEKLNGNKRAEVATLQAIAHTRPSKIRSAEFAMLVGLTSTPIAGAVKNLEEQGIIREEGKRWILCEPSYEAALKIISEFHFDSELISKVIIASEE